MRIHAVSLAPMSEAQKRRLGRLGDVRYFDAVVGDPRVAEQCRGAEALIVTPRIPVDIVAGLEGCRFISVQGAGVDALDLEAARRGGIVVSNVPDFCSDAVAEHAFALLLAVAKRLERGRPLLDSGGWTTALAYPTVALRGKTLGLFGCGRIGGRIVEIGRAFGMTPIAAVRDPAKSREVETVSFDKLLAESDFLVLAAPATPETEGLFDRRAFSRMKADAIFVNVSRGALVVEADLIAALEEGRPSGAATDVFRREPPLPDDPLLGHEKLFVSPHVAWGSSDAVERLLDLSIANVEAFAAGRPINVVT